MHSEKVAITKSTKVGARAKGLRRTLLMVGSAGLIMSTVLPQAFAMTLEEAMKVSVDSHPMVLAEKAGKEMADFEIKEARARYRPDIDTELSSGYDDYNNATTRHRRTRGVGGESSVRTWHNRARLDVRQMLFDGFETENLVDAARWRAEVNKQEIHDAEEEIALRTVEAYLAVLRTREVVDLSMENVQTHIDTLGDVELRAETGGGNQADVLQAESRLANATDRLLEQKGDLREAETDFYEVVGVLPDELMLPDAPTAALPVSLDEATTRALAGNPSGRAAEISIEARREDAEAAEAPFLPRFDLELAAVAENNVHGVRDSGTNFSALALMRYNLYRGGGDTARLRRAREFVNQTMLESRETDRLVVEQIRLDWNDLQTARSRIPQLENRVVAATQVVSAYRQQFELGQRSLLDVLDVQNELFQSRVRLVEGEYEVLFSHFLILETLGTILDTYSIVSQDYAVALPPTEDPNLLLLGD
jgi:adhesin transport system outer membrane protein